jgi:hypothetical protein
MQAGVTALGSFGVGGAFCVNFAITVRVSSCPCAKQYARKEHKDAGDYGVAHDRVSHENNRLLAKIKLTLYFDRIKERKKGGV